MRERECNNEEDTPYLLLRGLCSQEEKVRSKNMQEAALMNENGLSEFNGKAF